MAKIKTKSSKEILIKKKNIKKLMDEKKKLELEIKISNENINLILNEKISDASLNKLPIESLQELYVRKESITEHLNQCSKERKNKELFLDKISKLENKIQEARIDLAIEKINLILKELNE
jgi:hypothetical protein